MVASLAQFIGCKCQHTLFLFKIKHVISMICELFGIVWLKVSVNLCYLDLHFT